MDIASAIAYDQTFPVALRHPGTGEEVGITFNIVSFDSERVVRAVKVIEAERWAEIATSADKKLSAEKVVEYVDKTERAQIEACIDSWDFGGHGFGDLGDNPDCTADAKKYLVNHPNANWIRLQIAARAADLGNFSQAQPKPSRKPSARK